MFEFFKPRKVEVIKHWYALIPDFNASTQEFYSDIETELKQRQVPGLKIDRVEFAEGGILSAKRFYLRMTRERLVFDVCAAPFGTAYFFSCRFAEIPIVVHIAQILILLIVLSVATIISFAVCIKIFGFLAPFVWPVAALGCALAAIYTMRNAVAMGLKDLDASLVKMPIFGPVYESWFRRETYYRQDTRLMYVDLVDAIVKEKVEETTSAKGVKLVRFNEHDPILGELYKPRLVALPKKAEEADAPCPA